MVTFTPKFRYSHALSNEAYRFYFCDRHSKLVVRQTSWQGAKMEHKTPLEIIEFTDPVCTWCWGSEPVLRKLQTHYKDQVRISFVMGGLVEDITEFYDDWNHIGGDPDASNQAIVSHWLEASQRHGMPVRSEGFALFSKEYPSTYPQNIAYKAAQMESEMLAHHLMRRMREASAAEAKQTSRMEVLVELASEVGLDITKFIERMSDGSAEKAFKEDQKLVSHYAITGFPSFLIRYGNKELVLRGYQKYSAFKSVIKMFGGGHLKEIGVGKTPEDVLDFIAYYGRVTPKEIEETFEFQKEVAHAIVETLRKDGLVKITPVGNGHFIDFVEEASCSGNVCGM